MSEWKNELINLWKIRKKWTNELMKELMNERMKERKKEWKNELMNLWKIKKNQTITSSIIVKWDKESQKELVSVSKTDCN